MKDDTISRQAAIETVHRGMFDFFDLDEDDEESPLTEKDKMILEINKKISASIKSLPAAEPRWIPVCEHLPLVYENTQVSDEVILSAEGSVFPGALTHDGWCNQDGDMLGDMVVDAWMPLPEPWKGEDDATD